MAYVFLRCDCGHVSDIKLIVPRLVALTGYPNVEYTCDDCWRTDNVRTYDDRGELRNKKVKTTGAHA